MLPTTFMLPPPCNETRHKTSWGFTFPLFVTESSHEDLLMSSCINVCADMKSLDSFAALLSTTALDSCR
jgi:hypothetical protein